MWTVNSFELPLNTVKDILDVSAESFTDKTEHGFRLCNNYTYNSTPGTTPLDPGTKCTGEVCEIDLSKSVCGIGGHYSTDRGDFHTHPAATSNPSAGDLLSLIWGTYKHGKRIDCRAGQRDKSLTCDYVEDAPEHPYNSDVINQLGSAYSTLSGDYTKYIDPFYAEWKRTGNCPVEANYPGFRETYDRIVRIGNGLTKRKSISFFNLSENIPIEEEKERKKKESLELSRAKVDEWLGRSIGGRSMDGGINETERKSDYPRTMQDCDTKYSIQQVRDMCKKLGISGSGAKKKICNDLIRTASLRGV